MSARATRSPEGEEARLLRDAQYRAKKILADKKNVSEPGAGFFVVKVPGRPSVSGHFDELLHHVTQALMNGEEVSATA